MCVIDCSWGTEVRGGGYRSWGVRGLLSCKSEKPTTCTRVRLSFVCVVVRGLRRLNPSSVRWN